MKGRPQPTRHSAHTDRPLRQKVDAVVHEIQDLLGDDDTVFQSGEYIRVRQSLLEALKQVDRVYPLVLMSEHAAALEAAITA